MVFDELKSWYGTSKCIDVEGENDEATMKASKQESCELSGPDKSSQTATKVGPWSGRLRAKDGSPNASFGSVESRTKSTKGKEKVNQPIADFYVSTRHSSGDESLDEEIGIPKVKTPGVHRMEGGVRVLQAILHATDAPANMDHGEDLQDTIAAIIRSHPNTSNSSASALSTQN